MRDKILNIHEFKTKSGNKYVFDNATGRVFLIDKDIKYIIENFSKGKEFLLENLMKRKSINIDEYKRKYNYVERLITSGHFYTNELPYPVDKSFCKTNLNKSPASQLILIVTEECNLRCKYCVYSENYPNQKTYTNKVMNFETAKKAVDNYISIYNEKRKNGFRKKPIVSFYGGEPLLEYKLIDKVINYCKDLGFDAEYTITTNGTVMNDEVLDIILKNNIQLTYSLDGYKENHDRNRIFVNGKKSFDIVLKSMKLVEQKRKELGIEIPINVSACYDLYTDMEEMVSFFEELKLDIGDFGVRMTKVYEHDTTYYDYCDKQFELGKIEQDSNTLKNTVKRLQEQYIYNEANGIKQPTTLEFMFQGLTFMKNAAHGPISPTGTACAVGDKLAVDSDGKYYVCEKATQQYEIGNIDKGLEESKVYKMYDEFLQIRNRYCSRCPFNRLCDLCYVHLMKGDKLEFNEEFCKNKKVQVNKSLKLIYSVLEQNQEAFSLI